MDLNRLVCAVTPEAPALAFLPGQIGKNPTSSVTLTLYDRPPPCQIDWPAREDRQGPKRGEKQQADKLYRVCNRGAFPEFLPA